MRHNVIDQLKWAGRRHAKFDPTKQSRKAKLPFACLTILDKRSRNRSVDLVRQWHQPIFSCNVGLWSPTDPRSLRLSPLPQASLRPIAASDQGSPACADLRCFHTSPRSFSGADRADPIDSENRYPYSSSRHPPPALLDKSPGRQHREAQPHALTLPRCPRSCVVAVNPSRQCRRQLCIDPDLSHAVNTG